MKRHLTLVLLSWYITLTTFIYVYGGFHPPECVKDRILLYSKFLLCSLALILIIKLLKMGTKLELVKDILLIIFFTVLQILLLN
jgi:hypothetical protein